MDKGGKSTLRKYSSESPTRSPPCLTPGDRSFFLDHSAYHHKLFLRGQRDLAYGIPRTTLKGTKVRKPASPDHEPDFYSMPFMPPSDSSTGVELVQDKSQPVECQETSLPTSSCSPCALALMHNDTMDIAPGPRDEGNGNDFNVVPLRDHCEDVNQSKDTGPLNYCKTLEPIEDPPSLSTKNKQGHLQNEGQLETISKSLSSLTEQVIMAESGTDLEDQIYSAMPLNISRKICASSMVSRQRTDMTDHQRPCRNTRIVAASTDRIREICAQSQMKQSCRKDCMKPVRDDIPRVLCLQLPTISDQYSATSKGLTFARALASQPNTSPKIPSNETDGESPGVSAQRDKSDHLPVVISPLIQGVTAHDYFYLDKTLRDCHVRIASWSTGRQEDDLGPEGLPADTELEEYIAFHMNGMGRS